MEPRQVKTAADALKIVKQRGLSHVKVGVHDIDGVLRGKYIHIDKFKSALEGGMGFCDVVLGWDINDQLYDNVTYTGWHTAYPDANVRILPRDLPRDRDRARQPAVPLRVRRPGRGALPARPCCAACSARAEQAGLRGQGRLRVRVLRLRRDGLLDPREGLQEPEADLARLLRLFGAAQLGPVRLLQGPARHVRDHGHGHRGPAHRDRRRRARGGAAGQRRAATPPTAPRCSSSSPRCWRRSATGSPPSWPSGRRTGRAAAATCTCRCGRTASRSSSTRRRRIA